MIGIIYNPVAAGGKYKGRMRDLLVLLDSLQIKYEYRESEGPGDAGKLALEMSETCSTIIPAGGDGTVSEVLTALKDKDVRLAILPYGSGNDSFISVYGDDCSDEGVLEHVMSETDLRADCFMVNGKYRGFLLASYGFGADLVKNFKEKGRTYFYQAFKMLFGVHIRNYTITVNGTTRDVRSEFVSVINTGYAGGGIRVNSKSSFTDGEFELMILHESSMFRRFANFAAMARGKLDSQPNMEVIRTKECSIIAKDDDCINVDGELYYTQNVDIRITEGGLRFAYRR